MNQYDVYLVGVGGQGVLTIGDILAEAALAAGIPVNFFPTKGMAQRGGFVKAQLRLGRKEVGPNITAKSADLVIAMELSEALKAVRFIKPGKDYVLFGHEWTPTAVMLGKARYPTADQVLEQIRGAGANVHYLDPSKVPLFARTPLPANIYTLGAVMGRTGLRALMDPSLILGLLEKRWKKGAERNRRAFDAGMGTTCAP